MLVISRKVGQIINIGDNVEVVVVSISPTTVRLGIKAPNSVRVVRSELIERDESDGNTDGRATV